MIIELSADAGKNWDFVLSDSAPNTGSYDFSPDSNHVSPSCLVRVSSDDRGVQDESNAVFTIE